MWESSIDWCLSHAPQLGTETATQARALMGNWTGDFLLCSYYAQLTEPLWSWLYFFKLKKKKKKARRYWIFGIFFIFIHMTRFYTKNTQLNSTNLHSWGMLKKIQLKNPRFPVTHNSNILQCRGKGSWGKHPKHVFPKRNDWNFTFPLHTGSKWWRV